ncbi:exonuclease SbcC [Minicystis rosea]|nr:exonuclease SbcC [Minicystis rosea]
MTSEDERAPELLRADREQLDRAASLLAEPEPALVIVACPKDLVPASLAHLRERVHATIPDPAVLSGSQEVLDALVGATPAIAAAEVRSIALRAGDQEALRALNWHREKLLRGTPVVLWLDGIDALTELRSAAPDAYSFRDMVVLVRGDRGRLSPVPHKESRGILSARRRLSRAQTPLERGLALASLAEALRTHGHLVEAENVATRGLADLPEVRHADEVVEVARAALWATLAMAAAERGSRSRQQHATQRGLAELQMAKSELAQEALVGLLTAVPGPFQRCDRASVERALALSRGLQSRPDAHAQAARAASRVAAEIGDIGKARALLAGLEATPAPPLHASLVRAVQGDVERRAGRLADAETSLQQAIATRRREHAPSALIARAYAISWLERGELAVAERVVSESFRESDATHRHHRRHVLALIALARGEMDAVREQVRAEILEAAREGLDQHYFEACRMHAQATITARDAGLVDADEVQRIAAELAVAADVSPCLIGDDPPAWCTIRSLGCRAALLARADRGPEALGIAQRALDLAGATYPDLVPEAGRVVADQLLGARKPDAAFDVLAAIEPEASRRGMLKELGRLRAARVLALVLRDEPPAAVERALAALRETLESTRAPRIKAETLLELAIRLPPGGTLPDPLALAGETLTSFVEMPMPAREARSLELIGDILAARGKPADAARRHRMAHHILERRGLGLRLPLISAKIARLG